MLKKCNQIFSRVDEGCKKSTKLKKSKWKKSELFLYMFLGWEKAS